MTKTIFQKIALEVQFNVFILTQVPFVYMEGGLWPVLQPATGGDQRACSFTFQDVWGPPDNAENLALP